MHSLECHYFLAVMHGNFHDCVYIISVEEWTVRTMNTNDGQNRITFFDIELQKMQRLQNTLLVQSPYAGAVSPPGTKYTKR